MDLKQFEPVLTKAGVLVELVPEEWVELRGKVYSRVEYHKVNVHLIVCLINMATMIILLIII